MRIEAILSMLLSVIAIYLLFPKGISKVLSVIAAFCISAILHSLIYFVVLTLDAGDGLSTFIYYSLIIIVLCFAFYKRTILLSTLQDFRKRVSSRYFLNSSDILFLGLSMLSLVGYFYYAQPWGGWDGWAIWNLHAKQLLTSELDFIQNSSMDWSHPDYPLAIPGLIALLHRGNSLSPEISALVHVCIWIVFQWTLYGILKSLKIPKLAQWLILICLLMDPHTLVKAGSQMADVSIALVILITIGFYLELLKKRDKDRDYLAFFWLGMIASFPIWIKNEGFVFFTVFTLYVLFKARRDLRLILGYILGASPTLFTWAYFKSTLALSNPLFDSDRISLLAENLIDYERWEYILTSLTSTIIDFYLPTLLVAAFILFEVWKGRFVPMKPKLVMLLICFTTYIIAFFVTPYDYQWHIDHSIDRLIFHFIPSFLVILLAGNTNDKLTDNVIS